MTTELRLHLNAPAGHRPPSALIRSAVEATLSAEGIDRAELSLTLLDDESARRMNRRWLSHDWIPDVLTFPLHEPGEPPHGDIYIGADQAARQAAEAGVSLDEELARLAIHGVLHLLGYDHPEEPAAREASPHYLRQEELLARVLAGGALDGDAGSGAG